MADKDKAHLGCLEEDDEFEEFPAEGKRHSTLFYWFRLHCGRMHDVFVDTEHWRVFQNGVARKRTKTKWMSGKTTGMTIMSSETSADNCAPKGKHSSVVWRKTTSSKSSQLEVSVVHKEFIDSFLGWLMAHWQNFFCFQNGLATKRMMTMWMFGRTIGMMIMSRMTSANNCVPNWRAKRNK